MDQFTEQLLQRLKQDQKDMSDALIDVADSLNGYQRFHEQEASMEIVRREIETICRYYRVAYPKDIPETQDVNEMIDYLVRPSGIMYRRVLLQETWWKDGDGAIMAIRKDDGRITALLPGKMGGYRMRSDRTGAYIRLTKEQKDLFEEEALCFYRPLPAKPLSGRELIWFLFQCMSAADIILVILASLMATGVGMLTPLITQLVFSQLIPTGKITLIGSMAILLISAAIGVYLITAVKTRVLDRIRLKMDVTLQNAVTGRLLHLPAGSESASGHSDQCGHGISALGPFCIFLYLSDRLTGAFPLCPVTDYASGTASSDRDLPLAEGQKSPGGTGGRNGYPEPGVCPDHRDPEGPSVRQ